MTDPHDRAEQLRLLLVGAGRMGRTHLDSLTEAGTSCGLRIVAAVEPNPGIRADLQGAGIALHADLTTAMAAGGFDAALVAVPSGRHREVVSTLVDHGIPTLCEKPCGLRSQDAEHLAQCSAETGTLLQVGYWRRFVPDLVRLRTEVAAGHLGEISLIQAWQWDAEPPAPGFRATSGGPLLDMGVHEIDMIRWLTGQELVIAAVQDSTVQSGPTVEGDPESLLAIGRLSGGGVAAISLGRRYDRGDCCWVEVIGTRASRRREFMVGPPGDHVFRQALVAQAGAFAAGCRGETVPMAATVEDAGAALRIVEAATS